MDEIEKEGKERDVSVARWEAAALTVMVIAAMAFALFLMTLWMDWAISDHFDKYVKCEHQYQTDLKLYESSLLTASSVMKPSDECR